MPTPCPRSRASSGADRNLSQITTHCRSSSWASQHCVIKLRAWGRGVLAWKVGPALNGALQVPQSGGGFSGAGAGFAEIRLGSCGNVADRIGGLCGRRSVIDRGAGTLQRPSHSCADGANRDQGHGAARPGGGRTAHRMREYCPHPRRAYCPHPRREYCPARRTCRRQGGPPRARRRRRCRDPTTLWW
jgi:hypothetical protein